MLPLLLAAGLLIGAPAPAKGPAKGSAGKAQAPKAPARPRSLVVLLDAPALSAAAQGVLLEGIKREVARSAGYVWQEPPPVTVDELIVALSCKKVDVDCVMRMGEVVRADSVLVATLGGGRNRDLALLLVQFRPDRSQQKTGASLRNDKTMVADAAAAVRGVLGPVRPAALEVVSVPAGALVVLDGVALGPAPVTRSAVPEGHHEVTLTLEGYLPQARGVDITAGDAVRLEVALEPEPRKAPPAVAAPAPAPVPAPADKPAAPATAGPPAWAGPARLGLLGAGGVGLGAGALTAVAGLVLLGVSAALYALVWTVQAAIRFGAPLVYPTSVGGLGVGGLGLLLLPLGAFLLAAGVAVGLLFR
ncbi:MAG: PEGA domain-containing protein [Deltaproteobacteria bacterium]|nr:PEGA domain-containing protein [Deltaproteobacteria bacterium]